ncbi:MAG: single-stranded-DNA-specific exonuclease RecJ [Helicobacteraceae bacterium]|jgi:single-stranded-DNA-specific exonuclease|nr:single-stranded-DNA-specific exonuclease RecJ [Helicobacteraceae bacterium]
MIISDTKTIHSLLADRFKGEIILSLGDLEQPEKLSGMSKAVERVVKAKDRGEEITIVSDYDVDGVVASAVLSDFFDDCGIDSCVIFPDRLTEGYGISKALVEKIKSPVAITVDNGILAHEAASMARDRDISLIITDHHNPSSSLPDAEAVINPKLGGFLYAEICGAAVAWYLAAALRSALGSRFSIADGLDLVAIATIADRVPLHNSNRVFARAGLAKLNASKRPCFEVLRQVCGRYELGYDDIAFLIAPKLNAAGRFASAEIALDFIRAKSFGAAAEAYGKLDRLSNERKAVENSVFQEALKQADETQNAIVVGGAGWHEGVIGIVAARLAERFCRCSVVFSINGTAAKGSARSYGDADLYAQLLACGEFFEKLGGHKKAAGIAIRTDMIEPFKKKFLSLFPEETDKKYQKALGELHPSLITPQLQKIFKEFEPFGEGNPKPLFYAREFAVKRFNRVGKDNNHLQIYFENGLHSVYFNAPHVETKSKFSFFYSLMFDEYRGERRVKLRIERIDDAS